VRASVQAYPSERSVPGLAQPPNPTGMLRYTLSVSRFLEKTMTFPFVTNACDRGRCIHRVPRPQLAFSGGRGLLQRGCAAPGPHPTLLRALRHAPILLVPSRPWRAPRPPEDTATGRCWCFLASSLELVYPSNAVKKCWVVFCNVYRTSLQAHGTL
jgi:hypothetical protein